VKFWASQVLLCSFVPSLFDLQLFFSSINKYKIILFHKYINILFLIDETTNLREILMHYLFFSKDFHFKIY
jgi:hypothetical protein